MAVLQKVLQWLPDAIQWGRQTGLPPALVLAVIHQESGGNPNAFRHEPDFYTSNLLTNPTWQRRMKDNGWGPRDISSSYGLMQLLFTTAYGYGCSTPSQLYTPNYAVRLGCAHLSSLKKHLDTIQAVLATYNGGFKGASDWRNGNDTAPVRYVKNVLSLRNQYERHLTSDGAV